MTGHDAFFEQVQVEGRRTGCIPEGQVVTGFYLVGMSVGVDAEKTNYFRIYSGGSMASHLSLGLLDIAATMERDYMLSEEP